MPRFRWPLALIVAGSWLASAQFGPSQKARVPQDLAHKNLIEDLVHANHILAEEGIVDAFGHVSARDDRNPQHYFLARSVAPALVKPDDIIQYDLDSNPIGDSRPGYRERFIHGEIYKARPDVMAVVHDHSPSVIPFSVSATPLRPILHTAAFLGEGVPVFEIRDVDGMTNMLVETPKRGRALAQTLGENPAVLMRGHGAAIVGPTIKIAVARSVYLDLNAKLQAQAMLLGGKVTYLQPEEARKAAPQDGYERAWEMWKRKVTASR